MKFHNQHSFMGHEIFDVNNKPLLHKKGKQWIVVAVSALILAGFGGMVSTTTHADITQPTTTKVAPKPANGSASVMKQAQGMHKALTNNAAVQKQKPSAPSSVAAKKISPASAASTNSAGSKSSSASSNSNSSNNKANKPTVHMMLMSTPVSTPEDPINHTGNPVHTGKWNNANWAVYKIGTLQNIIKSGKPAQHNSNDSNAYQLDIYNGQIDDTNPNFGVPESDITNINTNDVTAPDNATGLFAANGVQGRSFNNLQSIDLLGLNTSNTTDMSDMFHGDGHLLNINLNGINTQKVTNMNSMFDDDWRLQALDLSSFKTSDVTTFNSMFWNTPSLQSLNLSNFTFKNNPSVGAMFIMNEWGIPTQGEPNAGSDGRMSHLDQLVLPTTLPNNFGSNSGLNTGIDITNDPSDNTNTWGSNNGKETLVKLNSNGNPTTDTATEFQGSSAWAKVANDPGNWVNRATLMPYTIYFTNEFTNSTLSGTTTYNSMKNASSIPFNGIDYPNGYVIAPNAGTTTIPNGNTASIDVIPQTYKGQPLEHDGVWGHATWALYGSNNNTLVLADGNLESNAVPSSDNNNLQDHINSINNIITRNNVTTSNASDLFTHFNKVNTLDLSNFDDTKSASKNLLGLDQYGHGQVVPTIILGNNAELTGTSGSDSFIYAKPNNKNYVVNIADGKNSYPGTYSNIVKNKVNYIYPVNKSDAAVTDTNVTFTSNNNAGSFQPISQKGLSTNVNWNNYWTNYGYDRIPGDWNTASWVKDHEASDFKPNINSNDGSQFTFSDSHSNHNVIILPNIVTDTVQYVNSANHNQQVGSNQSFSGFTNGALSNTSNVLHNNFEIGNNPKGLSSDYQVTNPNQPIGYDGTTHQVAVTPKQVSDTINYMNGSTKVGSDKPTGAYGTNIPNITAPARYKLDTTTTLTFTHGSHSVNVTPIQNTDTVNYRYNNNLVSSTKDNGADISTFNANNKVPAGYYATDNTIFKYDGGNHTVNVLPNQDTDTINYQYNGKTLATYHSSGNDYRATSAGNNSFDITSTSESGIPSDYQLVNSDNTIQFDNKTHNVAITPIQKSDVVDYMNNDLNIASDVYTGNDMYANGASDTTFDANKGVPAGYHVANDGGNTFYFDGQKHDVTVYPNSITLEFNNGQAGSKKIDNLKGTTYQINSSDVPANYQLTNPSDDVIDLGNLGNNIDYNVDVSPAPQSVTPTTPSAASNDNVQPSVPYIPSMPVSSAASVSSASSSVAAPSSVASQTSVAPSASAPVTHRYYHSHYSHYRYAKVITPLQLHTSKHFTSKNGVLTIKHPTEFRIMRIVRDHKYTRYEVRYNHKNYFITANPKFTINDYVQKSDFKSRKHMMVRVITPLIEYKRSHFSKKYVVRNVRKGTVLPVKKVFTIGKGEMTRFQLTNGRYVTSNKLFVKVIK